MSTPNVIPFCTANDDKIEVTTSSLHANSCSSPKPHVQSISCQQMIEEPPQRGMFTSPTPPPQKSPQQGSLHYAPEHCLVNGGVPIFWVDKAMFKMGKMYLLRSPAPKKTEFLELSSREAASLIIRREVTTFWLCPRIGLTQASIERGSSASGFAFLDRDSVFRRTNPSKS